MSGKSLALAIFAPMANTRRVRMAPPEGHPGWNTCRVVGTSNINIKLAHGWTIIEEHGVMSTDVPESVADEMDAMRKPHEERIEQVLGEVPRKGRRPRIGQAGATIIALLFAASSFAQGPIQPADTLTFVRPISSRVTPEGQHRVNILTKGPSKHEYVIEVGWEDWEALKVGELVGPKLKRKATQ